MSFRKRVEKRISNLRRKTLAKDRDAPHRSWETVKTQFSSGLFSARVVKPSECQFNGVPGRSLLHTSPIHRKYTMTVRIEAGPLPTRVPEGSASSTLLAPYPPSFCLFAPRCRFFRGALDIENAHKPDTMHVVSRWYNFNWLPSL